MVKNRIKDLKIIIDCANLYNENLVGKNLLVIYINRETNVYSYVELVFFKNNYLHMTGVEFVQSSPGNQKAGLFFSKCLNNKLTTQEIMHRSDGNTSLKLNILKEIVNIHKSARMIGDFNEGHTTLLTEKMVGNVRACMGAVLKDDYYVPNTILKKDIRDIVIVSHPVKSMYIKGIQEPKYSVCNQTMMAKNFSFDNLPKDIKVLFD